MRRDQKALADIYSRIITESSGRKVIRGSVDLTDLYLKELPEWLADVEVDGGFFCNCNRLISLAGAPKTVEGDFQCDHNRLLSLEGSPETVGGHFYCNNNRLTSLQGAPKIVEGYFVCSDNAVKFEEEDVEAVCDVECISV
jgi:hypothetical protein